MKEFVKQWKKYLDYLKKNPQTIGIGWTSLVDGKTRTSSIEVSSKPSFEGFMEYLSQPPTDKEGVEYDCNADPKGSI